MVKRKRKRFEHDKVTAVKREMMWRDEETFLRKEYLLFLNIGREFIEI